MARDQARLRGHLWEETTIAGFTGGLNLALPRNQIEAEQSPNLMNVRGDLGRLEVDTGYLVIGQVVLDSVIIVTPNLLATVQVVTEFLRTSGAVEIIAITNETVWRLLTNVANSIPYWAVLSDGNTGTATGWTGTALTLSAGAANFANGDTIGVPLPSGEVYTVKIVSGGGTNNLVVSLSIGAGSITNPTTIHRGPRLTGGNSDVFQHITVPFHDWLAFTNNVDSPMRYDGTDVVAIPNLAGADGGAITKAQAIGVYKDHLILANTEQGGTRRGFRVHRSDTGDATDWAAAGNGGFDDISDTPDPIVSMKLIGDINVLYRKGNSFTRMEFVGTDDTLFRYRSVTVGSSERTEGVGLASPRAVAGTLAEHILANQAGVYRYNGGVETVRISGAVEPIFRRGGRLDPDQLPLLFMQFVEELDEVWVTYARNSDANGPLQTLRYSLDNGAWWVRNWDITTTNTFLDDWQAEAITCMGTLKTLAANVVTWATAQGSWASQTGSWLQVSNAVSTPNIAMGRRRLGAASVTAYDVVLYNFTAPVDAMGVPNLPGLPIPWSFESADVFDPGIQRRVREIRVTWQGGTFELQYSIDNGLNWVSLGTKTAGSQFQTDRFFLQTVSDRLSLRLSGAASGPTIGELVIVHREESRWGVAS